MIRNSSSNHSWTSGHVAHTSVEWENTAAELLCWAENEIGLQNEPCRVTLDDEQGDSLCVYLITISSFAAIFFLVAFTVLTRHLIKDQEKCRSKEDKELKELKDRSCRLLIQKFVKKSSNTKETDCSSNLLGTTKESRGCTTR
ncbi:uncharacterized protein LOC118202118 isoform X2 [Stegodyphus dumicola]|uniref:uncharacterized protein LOC118202118 isoform X2 n=1 Tax=Stegodyphus dumicola TaxID=202533 RepID=UPI0015B21C67|nr:uncharacterized protein LOC118202118 isoform X2 [Stegodyphus dumicola]